VWPSVMGNPSRITKPDWFSNSMVLSVLPDNIWQNGQVAFNGHSLTE
jgi:hypothetical protein